ncbi:hypothetical protein [Mycolicibacterium vinylchloridicum]|nr:hypothetical protein [Mycolicibacterium vinylchloridicum]
MTMVMAMLIGTVRRMFKSEDTFEQMIAKLAQERMRERSEFVREMK